MKTHTMNSKLPNMRSIFTGSSAMLTGVVWYWMVRRLSERRSYFDKSSLSNQCGYRGGRRKMSYKTEKYRERLIGAYGRNIVDEDMLRVVAVVEVFG